MIKKQSIQKIFIRIYKKAAYAAFYSPRGTPNFPLSTLAMNLYMVVTTWV